jgi:hypothetical protein
MPAVACDGGIEQLPAMLAKSIERVLFVGL